jgi:tetratricopeptide (TPR) repeat protein
MAYSEAAELHEQAVHLARQTGDKWLLSICLFQQVPARIQGDLDLAIATSEEALVLMRETGDTAMLSYGLLVRGAVTLQQGHYQRAAGFFTESLRLSRETGFGWSTLGCLVGLAGVSDAHGDHDRAAQLLGAAEALREALGIRRSPHAQARYDRCLASTRGALGDAAFEATWAAGRARTLEQAIEYALAPDVQ